MRTRLAALAAVIGVPAALVLGGTPAMADPAGNNGTVKIAEVDDAADPSNDPHVGCTFAVEWYGFDEGSTIWSDVTFESQAPTADSTITVTGATHVFVGGDPAGGGTDLDGRVVYTLAFTGTPQPQQGFHVTMTTDTAGAQGADKKSKVFWVDPCSTPTPTPEIPVETPVAQPVVSDSTSPAPALVPWSWDWTYAEPTCTALTVDYPANIPDGQSNDVNVRLETDLGPVTLNFHNNTGTWSGHTVFTYAAHPHWPAAVTSARPVWVQVGGTNYHWQGTVSCDQPAPPATTPDVTAPAVTTPVATAPAAAVPAASPPAAASQVTGFRAGSLQVKRGRAPKADWVSVQSDDADTVRLQRLAKGSWRTATTAAIAGNGQAKVVYPRLTKRGTYKFRVIVDGVATKPLVVKVR